MAAGAAWLLGPLARRIDLVSTPRADRFGDRSIPLVGGLAWATGLAAGVGAVLGWVGADLPVGLLGGVGLLATAGLVDDLRGMGARAKLASQAGAALCVHAAGTAFAPTAEPVLDLVLHVAFLVLVANAFNLIDNVDGLCAGTAAITLGALAVILRGTSGGLSDLALVGVGASLGVLAWNVPPARVFLGDSGSQPLGLLVGALAWEGAATAGGGLGALAVPVLVCGLPLFDVILVSWDRFRSRRSVLEGGTDHASHRLVAAGLSVRGAVAVLWAVALGLAAAGWAVRGLAAGTTAVVVIGCLGALALGVAFLLRQPGPGETPAAAEETSTGSRAWMRSARLATVLAVLLDLALLYAAHRLATNLRFEEGWERAWAQNPFLRGLPIVLGVKIAVLALLGEYRTSWRWLVPADLLRLGRNLLCGQVVVLVCLLYVWRFETFSRAVFGLDLVLSFLLLGLARGSFRLLGDALLRSRARSGDRRALVVGAGPGAQAALGLLRRGDAPVVVHGFLAADPALRMKRVAGIPVRGAPAELADLLADGEVDLVVLADPDLADEDRRDLASRAREAGAEVRVLRQELEPWSPAGEEEEE